MAAHLRRPAKDYRLSNLVMTSGRTGIRLMQSSMLPHSVLAHVVLRATLVLALQNVRAPLYPQRRHRIDQRHQKRQPQRDAGAVISNWDSHGENKNRDQVLV